MGTVYDFRENDRKTREFISGAPRGSLTATLYEISKGNSPDFSGAKGVIINTGNIKAEEYKSRIDTLNAMNVNYKTFGTTFGDQRLHAKTYATDTEAYISTGNFSSSSSRFSDTYAARKVSGGQNQVNIGYQTNDNSIVSKIREFHRNLFAGRPTNSSSNFLIGANTNYAVKDSIENAEAGSDITLVSPYGNDKSIFGALAGAVKNGSNVTLITTLGTDAEDTKVSRTNNVLAAENALAPDTDYQDFRKSTLARLQASGVNVLAQRKDDPLLIHTKALNIRNSSGEISYLGSSNLSNPSMDEDSYDVLVKLLGSDAKSAGKIIRSIKDVDLVKPDLGKAKPFSVIELRTLSNGTNELYSTSVTDNWIDQQGIKSQQKYEDAMPYFPTALPDELLQKMANSGGKSTIYQDLYKSRTGKEAGSGIRALDEQMSSLGVGLGFNQAIGVEIYKTGRGVLGSALSGIGRTLDYIFGDPNYIESEALRKGKQEGGIGKFLGLASTKKKDHEGPFESLINQTYDIATGMAQAIAVYSAVNMPIQHALAKLQQETVDSLLNAPDASRNWHAARTKVEGLQRRFVFGNRMGGKISDLVNSNEDVISGLSKSLMSTSTFSGNIVAAPAKDEIHAARMMEFHDNLGMLSISNNIREFDQFRFKHVLKPIFQMISPYEAGTEDDTLVQMSLNKIQEIAGNRASLATKISESSLLGNKAYVKHLGEARVGEIAKSMDRLGALLPLNIAYWSPAIRNTLGLPKFDPSKNMTWRDVFSIEEVTKYVPKFYSAIGNTLINPLAIVDGVKSIGNGQGIKANLKQFVNKAFPILKTIPKAYKLWSQQRQINKQLKSLTDLAPSLKYSVNFDNIQNLSGVYDKAASSFEKLSSKLSSFATSNQIEAFKQSQLSLTQKTTSYLSSRSLNIDGLINHPLLDKTLPKYAAKRVKRAGSIEQLKASKFKSLLGTAGLILLTDLVTDNFLLQSGSDLITQIMAKKELETKDGTVAKFKFDGKAPGAFSLGIGLAAGISTGFLIPKVVDSKLTFGMHFNSEELDSGFMAAKSTIEKVGTAAQIGNPADYVNKLSKARSEYGELLQGFGRHKTIKFNKNLAITAGLTAAFFTSLAFKGAAGIANALFNSDKGVALDSVGALMSASTERLLVDSQANAKTNQDWSDIALGELIAKKNLTKQQDGTSGVYSTAAQITTPFFQVAGLMKMDEQANKAVFSIGFQLAPVLGLGFSPILPFGIKLSQKKSDKEKSKLEDSFEIGSKIVSSLFSFGGNLTYEKDSPIVNNIEFIGLAALASAYNRPITRVGRALIDKLPRGVQADIYALGQQTKSIRKYTSGAMNLSRSMAEGITVLPFVAAHGTAQALKKVYGDMAFNKVFAKAATMIWAFSVTNLVLGRGVDENNPVASAFKNVLPAAMATMVLFDAHRVFALPPINSSRAIRTALPFYLAASLGRLMSDNDSGYTQKQFTPYEQFNAFVGSGLIFGSMLHSSGAFAHTEDITDTLLFKYSSKKRQKILKEALKDLEPEQVIATVKHLGALMPTKGFKRINADDNLLKSLSLETIVERTGLYEAVNAKGANIRTGKIKAFTARLKAAGKAYTTLTLGSSLIANLLNDSQLESLYKVPIIGQVIRLFSGVDPSNNVTGEKRTNRLKSFVSRVLKTATLGILDFDKATGAYQNRSDPFLSVFGPIGASFKSSGRTAEYFQVASPFSDLSFSSYKIGKMSASGSITNMEVLAKGTPAGLNANQALRLRIARLRGATPRKQKMQIDKVLSEYALESLTSSGIKRAINVQNFLVQNLAYQKPSELGLDMYREGLVTGATSSGVMKGFRLRRIFDPMSTLKGSFTSNAKNKSETKTASVKTIDDWVDSGLWSDRMINTNILTSLTNPIVIANKINNTQLSTAVVALVYGSTAMALMEAFSSLANIGAKQSLIDLANDSKIFNARPVTNKKKFVFTSFVEAATNKMSVIQVDLTKLDNVGYVFGLDADNALSNLVETNSPHHLSGSVSGAYGKHLGSVNKFFKDNFSAELNKNLVENFNPDLFKSRIRDQLSENLTKSFNRTAVKTTRGNISYYDSVFGGHSKVNPSLDKYVTYLMDGSDEFQGITSAIEEVSEYAKQTYKGSVPVGTEMFVKRRVELLDVFEKTTGFKSFIETIERPLTGEYHLSQDEIRGVKSYKSGTDITESSYKIIKEARNASDLVKEADYAVASNKSKIYKFGLDSKMSWSQKGLGSVLDAGKGASVLVGKYVEKAIPAYEMIEGASLALDKSQPEYLQHAGGESAVRSFVTTALTVGISAGLTFLGLPAIASLAIGMVSMMGFQMLAGMNKTLSDSQTNFVKGASNLIFKPVKTIAKVFKPLGLDTAFETVAGTILAPFGGAISLMAKAINSFTSSVIGPLLTEISIGSAKASPWQNMLSQLLLPQTAYMAEATSKMTARAELVGNIKQATKIGGITNLYSEKNGSAYYDNKRHFLDDATKNMVYGQSYAGGGRILSSFLSPGIRMSNLMRLAEERKRFLTDHFVYGSAINRMNKPEQVNTTGLIGMAGLLLAYTNRKKILKGLGKIGTVGFSRFDSVIKSSINISPKAFIDKAINLKRLAEEVLVTQKPVYTPKPFGVDDHIGHKIANKFKNFEEGIKFNFKASIENLVQKSRVLSYTSNTVEVATEASKNFERLSGQLFGSAKTMVQVGAPTGFSSYASLEQSGMYNIKKNAIRLSSTTEYGLGSSFVNKVFKSKSEFVALHELGHAYDSLSGVRLGLGNINSIGNQGRLNNKQIREVVRGMARDSVIQYASGNKISKKLISKIYRDEISASTRALVQMNSNNSEDLGLLLNKLAQEGKVSNIKQFKELVKNASTGTVKDTGIRFLQKKLNITIGPELKGLMKSAGTVKAKLFAPVSYTKFSKSSNIKTESFFNRVKSHFNKNAVNIFKDSVKELRSGLNPHMPRAGGIVEKVFYGITFLASAPVVAKDLFKGTIVEGLKNAYSLIEKPLVNTTRNLNARLSRLGLNLFDVLDVGFTGLDLMLGQESVDQARAANKNLSVLYRQSGARGLVSNRTTIMKSLEDSKSNQLGALTGNLFGVAGSLLSPNPIVGLIGGTVATAFGLIGFGGLNKYLANRDYERALKGHGTYDPIQSQGLYLRTHRNFDRAFAIGNTLLEKPREVLFKGLKAIVKKGFPLVAKSLDFAATYGIGLVSGGFASLAAIPPLLMGGSGFGIFKLTKQVPAFVKNFVVPLINKLPKFNMRFLSKLSNIKNIRIPNIFKNLPSINFSKFKIPGINFSQFKIPGIDFSKWKIPNINFGNLKLKLPKFNLEFLKNLKLPSFNKIKLPSFNVFKHLKLPKINWLGGGTKIGNFIKNASSKVFGVYKDFFSNNIAFSKLKNINFKGLLNDDNLKYQYWLWSNTTKSGKSVKGLLNKAGRVLSSAKFKLEDTAASLMNPDIYKGIRDAAVNSIFSINSKAGKAFNSLKYSLSRGVSKLRNLSKNTHFSFISNAASRLKSGINKASSSLKGAYTVAKNVLKNATNIDNYRYQYWLWANTSESSKLLSKAGSTINDLFTNGMDLVSKGISRIKSVKPSSLFKSIKSISGKLATSLKDLSSRLPKFNLTSALDKASLLGKKLLSGATKVSSSLGALATRSLSFASKLSKPILNFGIRAETAAIKKINRFVPSIGRTLAIKGFKETVIDAVSPVIDIATFGGGILEISQLNKKSTLADVEQAYAKASGAKNSLVGSILGFTAAGGFGDFVGSLVGNLMGPDLDKAKLRFDTKDFGTSTILEDQVKPIIRDSSLAYRAGKGISTKLVKPLSSLYLGGLRRKAGLEALAKTAQGSRALLTKGINPKLLPKLAKHERLILNISNASKSAFAKQVAKASTKLKALGGTAGERVIAKTLQAGGKIGKTAGKAFSLLSPIIDTYLIGSGYQNLKNAKSEADFVSGNRRMMGSAGSLAGTVIGGALLGPVGAIAGSLLGDFAGNMYGQYIGKEAHRKRLSGKDLANNQLGGGIIGGVLAGAAGVGLVALGLISAPLVIAGVALGALAGAAIGGYNYVRGNHKEKLTKSIYEKPKQKEFKDSVRIESTQQTPVKPLSQKKDSTSKGFFTSIIEYVFGSPAQASEASVLKGIQQRKTDSQVAYQQVAPVKAAYKPASSVNTKKPKSVAESIGSFLTKITNSAVKFFLKAKDALVGFVKAGVGAVTNAFQATKDAVINTTNSALNTVSGGTVGLNGGAFKLSSEYSALNNLSSQLSTNKYFNTATMQGRAAMGIALAIGGTESFGAGMTGSDFYQLRGGTGNDMQGFAQYNRAYHADKITTPENYINFTGQTLTGERPLPNSRSIGNPAMIIANAIQSGEITTGPQLEQKLRSMGLAGGNWEGLDNGWKRSPGLSTQLLNVIKNPPAPSITKNVGINDKKVESVLPQPTYQLPTDKNSNKNEALNSVNATINTNVAAKATGNIKTATVAQPANVAPSSASVKALPAPTKPGNKVITSTPYKVISMSGQNNGSGVRGNTEVRTKADITPHWEGTGGYTRYKRNASFKSGWESVLDGGQQVADFGIYTKDTDSEYTAEIRAAASGTVVISGGSYGIVGIKTSSGEVVRQLHNFNINVQVGQKVQFGQKVAMQGNAGMGGGGAYHSHIEGSEAIVGRYAEAIVSGRWEDTDIGAGPSTEIASNTPSSGVSGGSGTDTKAMADNPNSSLGSKIVQGVTGFLRGFMVFNVFKAVAALGGFVANKVMMTNGASGANRVQKRGERPMRQLLNAWGAYAPARQPASKNNSSPDIVNRTSQNAQQAIPITSKVPNMPGASDDERWAARTVQAAQRIGVSPKDLMAVMFWESDWLPDNSNNVNPDNRDSSGAPGHIGLIQFGPDYRRTKGITKAQIAGMSKYKQMDLVEDYLLNYVANGRKEVYQRGGIRSLYGAILAGDAGGSNNDAKDAYGTSVNNAIDRIYAKVGNRADKLLNSIGYDSKTGGFTKEVAPKPPAADQVKRVIKSDGKRAQAEINKIVAFNVTDSTQAIGVMKQLTTSFETAMASVDTKKQLTGAIKVIIPDTQQIALADTAIGGVMSTEVNSNVIDNNGRVKVNLNKQGGYVASNWQQITGADTISEYQHMETGLTENA